MQCIKDLPLASHDARIVRASKNDVIDVVGGAVQLDQHRLSPSQIVAQAGRLKVVSRVSILRSRLEQLVVISEDNADDHVHTRLLVVLVGENLQPDDPLNGYFRDRYEVMRTLIAAAVRSGQEDGEIRSDADPETVAAEVTAFIAGASLGWLLDPDAIDIGATYRDYVARLIADLDGRAATR